MRIEQIEFAERFRGPPRSRNGGYTCGGIAKYLQGTVALRLKAPPRLNTELRLESTDDEARLFHDTILVGEGNRSQLDLRAPSSPTYEEAEESARSFIGFKARGFPDCSVVGQGAHSMTVPAFSLAW